jgi:hypothetical protein
MPRRVKPKPEDESLMEGRILMLPPAKHHKHEHEADPYESLPGAVPSMQTTTQPLKREPTKGDVAQRKLRQAEQRALALRTNRYLEARADNMGDIDQALSQVFGVSIEEARERRDELHTEAMRGIGATPLGELLEQNDLSLMARVKLYARHAYSPVPAASLKALQEIGEMEGERQDQGSFESFLRLAKNSR